MEMVKKVWEFIDNKKTVFGAVVAFVAGGLFAVGVIDQSMFDQVMTWNLVILGVGLGHKVVKKAGIK